MKKNIIFISSMLILLVSCEDSFGPLENSQDSKENILQEAVIDDSDLSYLPIDTGGIHRAYPLEKTSADFGHYVYTPGGYEHDGPEYPLIIFLHGWGERGDGSMDENMLDRVLNHGPPKIIEQGKWNPRYPFIVVSPQLDTEYWPAQKVHSFIEYIIENYQINPNRIYLTGLSLGGGGCWYYVGEIDNNYAAAIIPISASGSEYLVDNLRKVPIWAFHGAKDELVKAFDNFGSVPMVEAINRADPPVWAKVTVYPDAGHDAWTRTYDGSGMFIRITYHEYNMNIYEWMLQYKKE